MKTNLNVDTQGLREKILDLAMRGKLVEQDAGDVISDDMPSTYFAKEKYKIPSNWRWVILGKIAKFYNGRAYKKNELLDDASLTPVLRVGNLFTNSSWYYSDLKLDENKYIDKGDLIYAWSASFGPKIWEGPRVIYHYHIWKIQLSRFIDEKFLYYFLLNDKNTVDKTELHGSTMKHITKKNMEMLPIPLPPLAEQRRIADKVSELFSQIDVIEKNVAEYQDLEQAMRSKLLDLAMRGKLVEQDPNDEPASELLEKIQAKKSELVKEGKIKKSKKLPEITDDEKPFDIPNGWEWSRFGEISLENIGGGTPDKSNPNYWNGEIPWMTVKDVHEGDIYEFETKDSITDIGLTNSSSNLIPKGNLIVVMRMGVGRAIITKIDTAINQDLRGFIFSERVIEEYIVNIFSALNFPTSGTTVKGIKLKDLLKTPIPLPPLEEQKRIVAKLEELFEQLDIINDNLVSAS